MTIETHRFDSGKPGKHLLIFGAIHGNEICGPLAIQKIIQKIELGQISFVCGSVTFVPICNAKAYQQRTRYFEENLNRVFKKTDKPQNYEADVANELCKIMDSNVDIFLDIHSMSAPGPISVFIDYYDEKTEALGVALGAEYVLLDWPKIYAMNTLGFESFDTTRYANAIGVPGVLVECGQHDDPRSVAVAEQMILRSLAFAGIIKGTRSETNKKAIRIRMKTVEKKFSDRDAFAKQWMHLDEIRAGEVIAVRDGGEPIVATEDEVILLPKHNATGGEEWFYTGVRELRR